MSDFGYFMVDVDKAQVNRPLRVTSDAVPQGDGAINHRRFANGTELTIPLQLWKQIGDPGEPACGEDLRMMLETLGLYVQAILNGRGRWFWSPSGYSDDRMLDEARWLVPFTRELSSNRLTTVTFGLDSPFPYFIDATEQTESIADGGSAVITNTGNHEHRPVLKLYGTTSGEVTVTNASVLDAEGNPLVIVYDGDRLGAVDIGGGDYVEIDTFRETAYLNGDQANRKAAIDPEDTDYWFLRPGDNEIQTSGVGIDVLYNNAWTPV